MAGIHSPDGLRNMEVDGQYKAARASIWPQPAAGEYRLAQMTGLLPAALAANAEIFQFRWGSATHLAAVKFIAVKFAVITGFTAAQELAFDVIGSTSWSVNGTGGTAIVPGGNNLKKRQVMPDSKVTDLRIATTAALGVGAKTLSGNPYLAAAGHTLAAAATVANGAFEAQMDLTNSGDMPLILAQNEGLSVRNSIVLGAAGTVRATVQIAWAEFDAADYPAL